MFTPTWAAGMVAVMALATPAGAPSDAHSDAPSDARSVLEAPRAHVGDWGVDRGGAMLVAWTRGWAQASPEALVVRSRGGREVVAASAPGVTTHVVADLPRGWLVSGQDTPTGLARVDRDADVHPQRIEGAPVTPRPGDVALFQQDRVVVYRPADDALHWVSAPAVGWQSSAYVTSRGALVVVGESAGTARWARLAHGRWTRGRLADGVTGAFLQADGDHLVVVLAGPSLGDGVDATPIAGMTVSDDGGRTWRRVAVPPHLVETLGSAFAADGTAFVVTGYRTLVVPPGADASVLPDVEPISVLASRRRLFALVAAGRHWHQEQLLVSRDEGVSWNPAVLPGDPTP